MKSKNSVKGFGILFFIVFLLVSIWPLLKGLEIRLWALSIAIIFLLLGLTNSKILIPLNKYWIKLGEILGMIIAPIVMMMVFFLILTPIALLLRLFGKDLLNINKKKTYKTYWITRKQDIGSMKNQF